MIYQEHVSLRPFNTFGIEAEARHYCEIHSVSDLQAVARQQRDEPIHILGGGSNVLLTGQIAGSVLHIRIPGRRVEAVSGNTAIVSAGAGEHWHDFVQWCLAQQLGGVENLSLIPGSVGAAPIQNIGAYGVELKDVFHSLEAVRLSDGELVTMDASNCAFGYRDSFFKREGKGRYAIVKVYFQLTASEHRLHLDYGAIQDTLKNMGVSNPDIHDISRAVIQIRQSKLPDPALIGNAGSFFKNPEIEAGVWLRLLQLHPNMPHFPQPDGRVKVPAGWLIEQCGWKGFREGDAGCYDKQALVLVNYGRATGQEILALARRIAASVLERFGIEIEPEVNVW
jgi:UDP-N-acetylmuramate dehydrogenase